jgi:hypothetical protein
MLPLEGDVIDQSLASRKVAEQLRYKLGQQISRRIMSLSQNQYANLSELPEYPFPVYISAGVERRAQAIAGRCNRAYRFLSTTLNFEAEVCLLVLAPEQWQEYTGSPMYGVPQTTDMRTIVVAGQNSPLWKMIIPPPERLPSPAAQAMAASYGLPDGSIDLAPYMDLLPVHEIGHLFIDQAAGQFDFHRPRRWLVELFCNLCLHAFIVAEEPEQLPNLETLPHAIVAGGFAHLPHRSLDDFERLYADMPPPNFVWYLSQLHAAAERVYDAGGVESLQRLHQTIVQSQAQISDDHLAARLRTEVQPEVEQVLTRWPN